MTEAFALWATEAELTEDSIRLLKESGFSSMRSVKLLNNAIIQKNFAKSLTLGQTVLLQQAVDSLHIPNNSTTSNDAQGHGTEATASTSIAPQSPPEQPPLPSATSANRDDHSKSENGGEV